MQALRKDFVVRAHGVGLASVALAAEDQLQVVPSGAAHGFTSAADGFLRPALTGLPGTASATVAFPLAATGGVVLHAADLDVNVRLLDAASVAAAVDDDAVIYDGVFADAALAHVPTPDGTEEFIEFKRRPATRSIRYGLTLTAGGLRFNDGVLEVIGPDQNPVLHTVAPTIIDSDGKAIVGHLEITGCAYDADPSPPWGRSVTALGGGECVVTASWDDAGLRYPILVDPAWSSAGSLITKRRYHSATFFTSTTYLPCGAPVGCVLVAGGTGAAGTLSSAELYKVGTSTWTSVAGMSLGFRTNHGAGATGNGAVLIAGGVDASGGYLAGTEKYNPSTGWARTGTLPGGGRKDPGVVTLPAAATDGTNSVVVVGGLSAAGTAVAAVDRFTTTTGAWSALARLATPRAQMAVAGWSVPCGASCAAPWFVVAAGGINAGGQSQASVEIYSSASNSWSAGGALAVRTKQLSAVEVDDSIIIGGGVIPPRELTDNVYKIQKSSRTLTSLLPGRLSVPRSSMSAAAVGFIGARRAVFIAGYDDVRSRGYESRRTDFVLPSGTVTSSDLLHQRVGERSVSLGNGSVLVTGGAHQPCLASIFSFLGCLPVGALVLEGNEIFAPSANGTTCTTAGDCGSLNCVDGVCCSTACDGQCEACNLPGAVGACSAVSGAPAGSRAGCATDGSACGGTCDGTLRTACAYPTSSCRSDSCTASALTDAASCNGAGSCPPPVTHSCGAYACSGATCSASCTTDTSCSSGNYCSGSTCVAAKPVGATCTTTSQCASGNCVDGVCCNTGCGGQCESCNQLTFVGTCRPVPHMGTPTGGRPACATDGTSVCAGSCDGKTTSTCVYPTVACRGATCAGATVILASSCDGAGACPAPVGKNCAPYACSSAACVAGPCAADTDCAAGDSCLNKTLCVDQSPPTWPASTLLTAKQITENSLRLSWSLAQDSGGIASYEVFKDGISLGTATTNSFDVTSLAAGTFYDFRVQATDPSRNESGDGPALHVRTAPAEPIAPPLDLTVATSVSKSSAYLYSGSNPVQVGVAASALVTERVARLRGRVTDTASFPMPGVTVSVLGHPELGSTTTRASAASNGVFDMVVNGGGALTVVFTASGYPTVQRQIFVGWHEYHSFSDDVVMTAYDGAVTSIETSSATSDAQVARGSVVRDSDGTRRAMVIFPPATTATMQLPSGGTTSLATLTLRATEYSVGANGGLAMPGVLPRESLYTYAIELSSDEAVAAGAETVIFNQDVYEYVENFLSTPSNPVFPIGTTIPNGYYDRKIGQWVAATSGVVIGITGIDSSGGATITASLDGADADATKLTNLGFTNEERQKLALYYTPGQTLWRVPQRHFTGMDLNFGADVTGHAKGAEVASTTSQKAAHPCQEAGSIIECENQTLGERIPLNGTGLSLNFRSDRTDGDERNRTVNVHLIGSDLPPPEVTGIDWEVQVAGHLWDGYVKRPSSGWTTYLDVTPAPVWDGTEKATGRRLEGPQQATITIGFAYPHGYQATGSFGSRPGVPGYGGPVAGGSGSGGGGGSAVLFDVYRVGRADASRFSSDVVRVFKLQLGALHNSSSGLGGWSLSANHSYDPSSGRIFYGTGEQGLTDTLGLIAETVPATPPGITAVSAGPDGRVYFVTSGDLMALNRDFSCAAVNAVGACAPIVPRGLVDHAIDVDVAQDGGVYLIQGNVSSIYRVSPDGVTVTRVAGRELTGVFTFAGDGKAAIDPAVGMSPQAVSAGTNGDFYFTDVSDSAGGRIRRVGSDGVVTTVAGGGPDSAPVTGSAVLATGVKLPFVGRALAADRHGNVFFGAGGYIWQLDLSGGLRAIAGNGSSASDFVDGAPALGSSLTAESLAIAPDDTLLVTTRLPFQGLFSVSSGVARRIAGLPTGGTVAEKAPARDTRLGDFADVTVSPSGEIFLGEQTVAPHVRRIHLPGTITAGASYVVPSEDASELYYFDFDGKHLATKDALTGVTKLTFGYDPSTRLLTTITDDDHDVVAIARDAAGVPLSITGPFGHTSVIGLDSNGHLATVTGPVPEFPTWILTTAPNGLLASTSDPNLNPHSFFYEPDGRLKSDFAGPGSKTLTKTPFDTSSTVAQGWEVDVVTKLGQASKHEIRYFVDGHEERKFTAPTNLVTTSTISVDGSSVSTVMPDGSTSSSKATGDPRFGMMAPVVTNSSASTGGLTVSASTSQDMILAPGDPLSVATLTTRTTVNGKTVESTFDGAAHTVSVKTPLGRISVAQLDANGRVITSTATGLSPAHMVYDSHGRLFQAWQAADAGVVGCGDFTATTPDDCRRVSRQYDATTGYLLSITDGLSRVHAFSDFDGLGRPHTETLPGARVVKYAYDLNGNVRSLVQPGSTALPYTTMDHQFILGALDLPDTYYGPDLGSSGVRDVFEKTLWNDDQQPIRFVHNGEADIIPTYEASPNTGRLASLQLTYPPTTLTTHYDAVGRVHDIAGPSSNAMTFTWNGSLLTKTEWSGTVAGSVGRAYDTFLRTQSLSLNDVPYAQFAYDDDGALISAGPSVGALVLTPDPLARTLSTTIGTSPAVTDEQTFTALGELSSYKATYGSTPSTYSETITTRDAVGRITGRTELIEGATHEYAYEYFDAGWLKSVTLDGTLVALFTYDANGNRLSKWTPSSTTSVPVGGIGADDRLNAYGATTYARTSYGTLWKKTDVDGVTTYTYDDRGSLLAVDRPGSAPRIEYVIDAVGRRIGKKVAGVLTKGWLYDGGLRIVAETDGTGTVISQFVYATHVNVPNVMIKPTGPDAGTYRIVTDHVGSVRLVVNVASGAVKQRIEYDPDGFGAVDGGASTSNVDFQPFGFAGGLYDPDTGLNRFEARDYSALTGRWTAKDPTAFSGGDTNLYCYAFGDPINRIDPSGLIVVLDNNASTDFYLSLYVGLKYNPILREYYNALDSDQAATFYINEDLTSNLSFTQPLHNSAEMLGVSSAGAVITWNPYATEAFFGNDGELDGRTLSPLSALAHECGHAALLASPLSIENTEANAFKYYERPVSEFYMEGGRNYYDEPNAWIISRPDVSQYLLPSILFR